MEEKICLFLVGFLWFIAGSLSATNPRRSEGIPQFYISQHGDRSTFLGATSKCISSQMIPTSLESAEEEAELIQQLGQNLTAPPSTSAAESRSTPVQEFWLGGTNMGQGNNDLHWLHSSAPLEYSNFGRRPNTRGRCIKLIYSPLRTRWAMEKCSKELRYICKPLGRTTWNEVQVRSIFGDTSDKLNSIWTRMSTVGEWIKSKLVATREFTVQELRKVVDIVQETVAAGNGADAVDANLVDLIKSKQKNIAERLHKNLQWSKKKVQAALKWAVDTFTRSVDHSKKTLYWVRNGLLNAVDLSGEEIDKVNDAVKETIVSTKSRIGSSAKEAAKWMNENRDALETKLSPILTVSGKDMKQILDDAAKRVFHPGMPVYDFAAWVRGLLKKAKTFTEGEIKKVIDVVKGVMAKDGVPEINADTIAKFISKKKAIIMKKLASAMDWAKGKVQHAVEIISAPVLPVSKRLGQHKVRKALQKHLPSSKEFTDEDTTKFINLLMEELYKVYPNAEIALQSLNHLLQSNPDYLKSLFYTQQEWDQDKISKALKALSYGPVLKSMTPYEFIEDDRAEIGEVEEWIRESLKNSLQYTDLEINKLTAVVTSQLIKLLPVTDISLQNAQYYIKNHIHEFIPIIVETLRWSFDKATQSMIQLVANAKMTQRGSDPAEAKIKIWLRQTLQDMADISEEDVLKLVEIIVEQLDREHPFGGVTIQTAANWIKKNFHKLTPLFVSTMSWNRKRAEKAVTDVTYVIIQSHPNQENRDDKNDSIESVTAWIRMTLKDAFTTSGLSAEEMSQVIPIILEELIKEHPMGDITIRTAANWLKKNMPRLMNLIMNRMQWNQSKADKAGTDVIYVIIQRHPDNYNKDEPWTSNNGNNREGKKENQITSWIRMIVADTFEKLDLPEFEAPKATNIILNELISGHPRGDITIARAVRWVQDNLDTLIAILIRGMDWSPEKAKEVVHIMTSIAVISEAELIEPKNIWQDKYDFPAQSVKNWIKTILSHLGDTLTEEETFRLTLGIMEQLLKERPAHEITVDTAADWMKNNAGKLESIFSQDLNWNEHQVEMAINKVEYIMVNQDSLPVQQDAAWNNEMHKLQFTLEKIRLWIRQALENIAGLTEEETDKVTALIMDELAKEYPLGDITAESVTNWIQSNIGNLISIITHKLSWNEEKSNNVVKEVKYIIIERATNDKPRVPEEDTLPDQYGDNINRVELWIRTLLVDSLPDLDEEEIKKLIRIIIQEVLKENPHEEITIDNAASWIQNNVSKLISVINQDLSWNQKKTENIIRKVIVIITNDASNPDDPEKLYPNTTYDLTLEKVQRWIRSLLRNVPDLSDDNIDQLTPLIIQELRKDRPLEEPTANGVLKWIRKRKARLVPIFSRGMNWSLERAEEALSQISDIVEDMESTPNDPDNDKKPLKTWIRRLLEKVPELTDDDIAELTVLIIRQMTKDITLEEITSESAESWIKNNTNRLVSTISRTMEWNAEKSENIVRQISYIMVQEDSNSNNPIIAWNSNSNDDKDIEEDQARQWLGKLMMNIPDLTPNEADRIISLIIDQVKKEHPFRGINIKTVMDWINNNNIDEQLIPLVSHDMNWSLERAEEVLSQISDIVENVESTLNHPDNDNKPLETWIRRLLEKVPELTDDDIAELTVLIIRQMTTDITQEEITSENAESWIKNNTNRLVSTISRTMEWNAEKSENIVRQISYIMVQEDSNSNNPIIAWNSNSNDDKDTEEDQARQWLGKLMKNIPDLTPNEADRITNLIIDQVKKEHPFRGINIKTVMDWINNNNIDEQLIPLVSHDMNWSLERAEEVLSQISDIVENMESTPNDPDNDKNPLKTWIRRLLEKVPELTDDDIAELTVLIIRQMTKDITLEEITSESAESWIKNNTNRLVSTISRTMEWNAEKSENIVRQISYIMVQEDSNSNNPIIAWNSNSNDDKDTEEDQARQWLGKLMMNIPDLTPNEADRITNLIIDQVKKEHPFRGINIKTVMDWINNNNIDEQLIPLVSHDMNWSLERAEETLSQISDIVENMESTPNDPDNDKKPLETWIRRLLEKVPELTDDDIAELIVLIIRQMTKDITLEEITSESAESWIKNNTNRLVSTISRTMEWNAEKSENIVRQISYIMVQEDSNSNNPIIAWNSNSNDDKDTEEDQARQWLGKLMMNIPDLTPNEADRITNLIIDQVKKEHPFRGINIKTVMDWINNNNIDEQLIPLVSHDMNWSLERAEEVLSQISDIVENMESTPNDPDNDKKPLETWIRRLLEKVPELTDDDIAELIVLIIRQMTKDITLEEITSESAESWIKNNTNRLVSTISRTMEWNAEKSENIVRQISYIMVQEDSNSNNPIIAWNSNSNDDKDTEEDQARQWLGKLMMNIPDLTPNEADRITILIIELVKKELPFRGINIKTVMAWINNNINEQLIPLVSRGMNWSLQKTEKIANRIEMIIQTMQEGNNWNENLGENFEKIKTFIRQALEELDNLSDKDIEKATTIILGELIREYPGGEIPLLKAVAEWTRKNIGKLVALLSRSMSWNAQKAEKTVNKVTYIIVKEIEDNGGTIDQDNYPNKPIVNEIRNWLLMTLRQISLPESEVEQVITIIIEELIPHLRVLTLEQAMVWLEANIDHILLKCGRLLNWPHTKTNEVTLFLTTALQGGELIIENPEIVWIDSTSRRPGNSLSGWLMGALSKTSSFTADEINKATKILTQQIQTQLPRKEWSAFDAAAWVQENANQLVPILSTGMDWLPQQAQKIVNVVTYKT